MTGGDAAKGDAGVGIGAQRVGSESSDDRRDLIVDEQLAGVRSGEVDDRRVGAPTDPRRARRRPSAHGAGDTELAEQPEVDVQRFAARPPLEEVLAVGIDPFDAPTGKARRASLETALGRCDNYIAPDQERGVVLGDAMDGVTFGHADGNATGSRSRRTVRAGSGAGTVIAAMTIENVLSPGVPSGPLRLIDDELATCVACGLCLPHCPTFRVTGEESASPRGRISAMRAVQRDGAPIDDAFVGFMDACVQCRGCETACPSGVPFGHLMEGTRAALAAKHRTVPRWQRLGYRMLRHHRLLLAGSTVLALAQRVHLVPKRFGLSRLPLARPTLVASGTDAWLFTGCVMDAWQRDVHLAVQRFVEATGAGVALPARGAACCGALHVHAGLTRQARTLARRVMAALPGDAPILVDSAGCGAALKDYGHLLDTDAARAFSARVFDIHEWLADRLDRLPPSPTTGRATVIVQDPCHLRHVQRAHLAVRTVVGRYANIVELDDDGLCCGAGGAYSALHPAMAADIRERKLAAIERAQRGGREDAVVVSANPGCSMHLAAAGVIVRHPIEIVAGALTAMASPAPSR